MLRAWLPILPWKFKGGSITQVSVTKQCRTDFHFETILYFASFICCALGHLNLTREKNFPVSKQGFKNNVPLESVLHTVSCKIQCICAPKPTHYFNLVFLALYTKVDGG